MILDSISPDGIRLPTLMCRYPKFIHGEAKTHRLMRISDHAYESLEEVGFMNDPNFSRNASSSRAIPVERMIQDVLDDPAMPVFWGKNRPSMQAIEEMSADEREQAIADHLADRDHAVESARRRSARGEHKQTVNRILEPWAHINVLVTSTEWANFFALRRHAAAQPEMRALADAIHAAIEASTPKLLKPGQWHLPFVTPDEIDILGSITGGEPDADDWQPFIKLCVARCARVSYLTHDGRVPNVDEDFKLYDRLVGSDPLHASPAEHQATPDERYGYWLHAGQHGNFVGWRQYRRFLPNESVRDR